MKNKKGQALAEFIILVPVLFMILFSILDFGQIYYQKYLLKPYKKSYPHKKKSKINEKNTSKQKS